MQIILFLLFTFFIVVFLIFSLFRKALSFLFGGLRSPGQYDNSGKGGARSQTQNTSAADSQSPKVFSKDEGEYVNFEEIESDK